MVRKLSYSITLVVIAFFSLSLYANNTSDLDATVFSSPRPLQKFKLIDNKGKTFTNKNFRKKWTFLFFGFTNCGYVCPTTMAILNQVYKKLEDENKAKNVEVVLVTIDPERDNVKKIDRYVESFNKRFIGLTGNKITLNTLSQQLGILTMKVPNKGKRSKDYQINHTGSILLLDPKGHLYASFSMPHDASKIFHDFNIIEKQYKKKKA